MTATSKNTASALRPTPKAGVMDIAAYVPGKDSAPGVEKVYKLSSNETPLGPSPHAIEAYAEAAGHLELYPDGQAMALRTAIAEVHGLNADNIAAAVQDVAPDIIDVSSGVESAPGVKDPARLRAFLEKARALRADRTVM